MTDIVEKFEAELGSREEKYQKEKKNMSEDHQLKINVSLFIYIP